MRRRMFFIFGGTMRKLTNPLKQLTRFEWGLWITSLIVVTVSFLISKGNLLSILASLIGVTSLIFIAKGLVIGQVFGVIFAIFYALVSYTQRYYGEMLTYLLMSLPIAIASIVTWVRNPYKDTAEVKVHRLTKKEVLVMSLLAVVTTVAFYFILKAFHTANLIPSTISVTTSFVACYMSMLRSPYYAVGYSFNDIVLIVLWILASIRDISYLPMVFCFVMFLVNDGYGFWNWLRIQRRQETES
ncbi:MAG: nicotinamide mononucleotide transporter [Clostridia bacterium]|nr:nicotinamide mononucleotide transporter [Clostridia bacterium]